jgi:leader peptidase (prepilin peptidase)/N-methyltransferase
MTAELLFAALIGLLVGSFVCLVAHRLPVMLESAWADYCAETKPVGSQDRSADGASARNLLAAHSSEATAAEAAAATPRYNLFFPPSHCPACGHRLGFFENVPLLSWLLQKGRCRACDTFIGWREPLVELVAAAVATLVVLNFDAIWDRALAALCLWMLLLASVIDLQRGWLPGEVTGPLLWLGLIANLGGRFSAPEDAVIGAVVGFVGLWLVRTGFRLATKREGMGAGDPHLLAAIGAWTGWQVLPGLILFAALLGLLWAGVDRALRGRSLREPTPFGPMLAVAGLVALIRPDWLTDLFYGRLAL